MLDIILNPLGVIQRLKKGKDSAGSWKVLLVVAVLSFVGVLISGVAKGLDFLNAVLGGAGIAILVFLGVMLSSFLVNFVLALLTGKSNYYSALTAAAYGGFIGVVGNLTVVLIDLIPSSDLLTTGILGLFMGIVMLFTVILAASVQIRLLKEFYECDILTVIVAWLIVVLSLFLAAAVGGAKIMPDLLKQMLPPGMGIENLPLEGLGSDSFPLTLE